MPKHRIFIIKPSGDINTNNALFRTTYDELNIDVDALFMDRHNKHSRDIEEFNNFNYWNSNALAITMPPELTDSESPSKDEQSQNKQESASPEKGTSSEPKQIPGENVVIMETSKSVSVPRSEEDGKESTVNNAEEAAVTPS